MRPNTASSRRRTRATFKRHLWFSLAWRLMSMPVGCSARLTHTLGRPVANQLRGRARLVKCNSRRGARRSGAVSPTFQGWARGSARVFFAVAAGVAVRGAAGRGGRAGWSRRGGWVTRGARGVLGQGLTLREADGCAGGFRGRASHAGAAAAYAGR